MRAVIWATALALIFASCGQSEGTQLGFVLLRAENLPGPAPLRADGFDREYVVRAQCQVLDSSRVEVAGGLVDVDPEALPGSQELRVTGISAGQGYFARIRGFNSQVEVHECGVTGPFELRKGEKSTVTIVIGPPEADDQDCERICTSHDQCPAEAYCPSACARSGSADECTQALCAMDYIGLPCATMANCGTGFACLTDLMGWPGGYCSTACVTDANCPGRSLCWKAEAQARCARVCSVDADCRVLDGYGCKDTGDGRYACLQ